MNNTIFFYLYHLSSNVFISSTALFVSYPLTYGLLALVLIWAIFYSERRMFNFSLLFLSMISSWFVASALKSMLHVSRPFVTFNLLPLHHETGFSLPSNHAAIFASIATVMFIMNRKLAYLFTFFALLVGVSRIVIGVHYPSDIIAGFSVGIIVGLLFIKLFKKI